MKNMTRMLGVCLMAAGVAQADMVVAGWDFGTGINASHTMAGIAPSIIKGTVQSWATTVGGLDAGSTDGTFGSGVGLDSSPLNLTPGTGTGLLVIGNAAGDSVAARFIVANNTGADLKLSQIQFDYFRNGAGAHSNIVVSVESTGITAGDVFNSGLIAVDSGATWSDFTDYTIDLTGLADHTLANGQSATFWIRFYSSDKSSNGLLDNFAVTAIPEPVTLGLIASFGGAVLFIRRRLVM